jgi:hypothetical protein
MSYYYLAEGKIVVYQLGSHDRAEVNLMMDFILKTMAEWDRAKPYLSIFESQDPRVIFTPHARIRLNEISASNPDLQGRSAGVVPFPALNHALRLFTLFKSGENRPKRVFTRREEAIVWLLEYEPED